MRKSLTLSITRLIWAAALMGACFAVSAYGQNRSDRTLSCSSTNGQRTVCRADTGNGVSSVRQLGDVQCVEGYTWGYTDEGVWVDRGCRAEFTLPARRADNWQPSTRVEPGTTVAVRTNEYIDSDHADGRIFTGEVDQDVLDRDGRLSIPRGSNVELIVRVAADNDLVLDLESLFVNGQRYAVRAEPQRVEAPDGVGANRRTGAFAGGGAALGAIIGAIAGGGKGAAIGAGAGAAAGLGGAIVTRGREVRIPAESILTFQMERPLDIGIPDNGDMRDGRHYHEYR
ncbi:MAG TPA: DUF3011 domain-containing protein [Bryobacteraceae bacterium]